MVTAQSLKLNACSAPDCDRDAVATGFCGTHYQRHRRLSKRFPGWPTDELYAEVVKPAKRGRPRTPYNADTVRKALAGRKGGWNPKLSKERVFAARDFGYVPSA